MKHLLRPYRSLPGIPAFAALSCAALAAAACLLFTPQLAHAQAGSLASIFADPDPLVAHASPSGYLGVEITDVDADKAQALKLKEIRGAVITLIDHDAPAGQIGLKVNDVVLAINGQNVAGAEQFGRMLHEIPPGRKISLEISRDGNIQTLAVQLVDRKALDHDIWGRIGNDVAGVGPMAAAPTMGVMTGGDAPIPPSGFHMSLFTSTLNVGAMVEPLTSQMAEYFGVQGGLMVKQIRKKSEAAAAGFKAFDVILKVGADSILTSADWDRALRSNQGKPVQVTILRDKKQQTITLQVDSKPRGAVEFNHDFDGLFAKGSATQFV
jgi:S1-C subfamily serine protease